jgi:glycosyltransferase involved in cell wall biosynthesis
MTAQRYDIDKGLLIVANYNQMAEIGSVLERCERYFSKPNTLVVDDGSTDGSCEYAQERGFRVIRHEKNMGIGAGIRTGIDFAIAQGYTWVLISSSNGKIRPEDFETVLPITQGRGRLRNGKSLRTGRKQSGFNPFSTLCDPDIFPCNVPVPWQALQ